MSSPCSRWVDGKPRLHYLEWNRGGDAGLILIHGNSANAWWWRPLADELSDFPGRIVALDLRGHGDSEWMSPPAYSPQAYADDIRRLVDQLGVDRPIIAGHSAGAVATLAFAARFPDSPGALVAIDVAATSSSRRNRYLRHLKAIPVVIYPDLATAKNRFRLMPTEGTIAPEVLSAIAERSLTAAPTGGYTMKFDRESFFGSDGLDVAEALREIKVPLLLVRAGESRILTAQAAAQVADANACVSLVTIPGAHHHVPLENPTALAAAIRSFLEPWSRQPTARPGPGRTNVRLPS